MDLFVHVYIKFVKKYLFFIDTFIRNLWAATDLFTSLFTVAFISRKLSRSPPKHTIYTIINCSQNFSVHCEMNKNKQK